MLNIDYCLRILNIVYVLFKKAHDKRLVSSEMRSKRFQEKSPMYSEVIQITSIILFMVSSFGLCCLHYFMFVTCLSTFNFVFV